MFSAFNLEANVGYDINVYDKSFAQTSGTGSEEDPFVITSVGNIVINVVAGNDLYYDVDAGYTLTIDGDAIFTTIDGDEIGTTITADEEIVCLLHTDSLVGNNTVTITVTSAE